MIVIEISVMMIYKENEKKMSHMEEPSLIQLLQQRFAFFQTNQQADAAVLIAITQRTTRRSYSHVVQSILSQHAGEVSFQEKA